MLGGFSLQKQEADILHRRPPWGRAKVIIIHDQPNGMGHHLVKSIAHFAGVSSVQAAISFSRKMYKWHSFLFVVSCYLVDKSIFGRTEVNIQGTHYCCAGVRPIVGDRAR